MTDKEDPNYIGFSLIADQYQRKTVKKGFEFTLMVVGESGLGKSTMINSLFLTDLYRNRNLAPVSDRLVKTTEIEKTTLDIEEAGVKLRTKMTSEQRATVRKMRARANLRMSYRRARRARSR